MTERLDLTPESSATEKWHPPGRDVQGWRDYLTLAIAVTYHVMTLQWLRAPRWKNKAEARAELARLMSEQSKYEYGFWAKRIEQTKRMEFTTKSGTWYQATVRPVWDDEPDGVIRVLVSVDDGGVGAFSPMCDDILVQPPRAV